MLKGISPLVAAVLLIAVTMAIAGALSFWASSFVRTQTIRFENTTVSSECNFNDFEVDSCSYNGTSARGTIILINIGQYSLRNISLNFIYPNGTVATAVYTTDLPVGSIVPYSFNASSGFSKIVIRTHCPNVFLDRVC